jgi:excisionase family DNA binding protein
MTKENLSVEQRLDNIEKLLTANKSVLTFDEGCNYTGLARSYMYKLTSTGKIPCYKPQGKVIYFERAELEKWLLRNRVTQASEIDEQASTYVVTGKMKGAK